MMGFAENLERGLFALGSLLRLPVMLLLWACVLWALFQAGAYLADLIRRRQQRRGFELGSWAAQGAETGSLPALLRAFVLAWEERRGAGRAADADLDELLLRHEDAVRSQLTGPRMLTKVGPSLGLLGTLIPMGASLAQLSSGDLDAMSGQMVVAFTTAIIGLSAGTLAFSLSVLRLRWVEQDLRELRYLAERMAAAKEA